MAWGWIIALIVGGVAGWLASLVMNRDASMGIFWNIVVGCVGSIVGNVIAGPLLGITGSVQSFSLVGLGVAVLGAIVLLGVVNLIQRGRVR
ncbi:MAG: GlsB/YeaQ/YmgE family stress response membrane protein [Pseudomonadota bacterium]